jgi:hypothetical protein
MERFIVLAIGAIAILIGLYLIIFNVPIEGATVSRYGNWDHSNIGGTPVLCIGVLIFYTAYVMKSGKKEK